MQEEIVDAEKVIETFVMRQVFDIFARLFEVLVRNGSIMELPIIETPGKDESGGAEHQFYHLVESSARKRNAGVRGGRHGQESVLLTQSVNLSLHLDMLDSI